jgi:hypothetical protein
MLGTMGVLVPGIGRILPGIVTGPSADAACATGFVVNGEIIIEITIMVNSNFT